MKKKIVSILLLMAALMMFTAGCGSKSEETTPTDSQENQVQEQSTQAAANTQDLFLSNWTLEPTIWSDGNGATVTFTATPSTYTEGLRAALSIRIGELEAESTNCNWDGAAFTGSVELGAADGYSYHCILFAPDGTTQEFELTSPENIIDETLVNMGTSLSAYANLMIEDWAATASTLTINSGYIQCQMPRLSTDSKSLQITTSDLVLKLNDVEVSRQSITLPAGEGEGSFEMALSELSFSLPTIEDEHQLDLWLEIILDNGNVLTVSGGSWYGTDTGLQMVVG